MLGRLRRNERRKTAIAAGVEFRLVGDLDSRVDVRLVRHLIKLLSADECLIVNSNL